MKAFYHEDYYFPLPEGHPFQMEKFPGGRSIVATRLPAVEIVTAREALEEEILQVHSKEHLKRVRDGTWTSTEVVRMGLPIDARLFRRCALESGGTIMAGKQALADGISVNLGGGTHHASASRASGYCLFNDVAIAVRALRRANPDLWVMIVDTDAHQGDGTHALFRSDYRTFTYSIHVGANFPSRKEPGDLDVPLDRWVDGQTYLDRLRSSLEAAFLEFEPDLVFWVAGADIHTLDRFGQMRLEEAEIQARNQFVLDLVRGWSVPLTIVYGGGYNRDPSFTNWLHALPILQAVTWPEADIGFKRETE